MSKLKKIALLVFIVIVFVFFISIPFFVKVKIDCQSQYGPCPADVLSVLNKNNGKNIFLARLGINKALNNNFLIFKYSTQFKLPDLLVVNILIKKPIFSLKNINSGKYEMVDSTGTVVEQTEITLLPTVTIAEALTPVGGNVSDKILFSLKLIQGVYSMYQVNTGNIDGDSLTVELPANIKVIFPLEGDYQVLLGSLRLIYSKVESPEFAGKYSQIDLRFKNPVLR